MDLQACPLPDAFVDDRVSVIQADALQLRPSDLKEHAQVGLGYMFYYTHTHDHTHTDTHTHTHRERERGGGGTHTRTEGDTHVRLVCFYVCSGILVSVFVDECGSVM